MKARYETPDFEVVEFLTASTIMFNDGDADGDISQDPSPLSWFLD